MKNLEYIKDGETEYCFAGDFDMLEALEGKGYDLSTVYRLVSEGSLKIQLITDVICASLRQVDKKDINETSKADIARAIIERHGLQEVSMICHLMLNHTMVGSKKKSQIDKDQMIHGMMDQLIGSESMTLKKRGLLWMGQCAISATLACTIISLLNLLG